MYQTFIGVDVSKDSFNYAIVDGELNTLSQGSFDMTHEGFKAFKEAISSSPNSVIAMESTGSYHLNLLSFLLSFKQDVCLVNPSLIKRFSQGISLRKTKTDIIDALIIAKFIAMNAHNVKLFTPDNMDDIVAIARVREDLAKQIARIKTQLKQHLSVVFPELLAKYNVFTDTILQILEHFPTTQCIKKAPKSSIKGILNKLDGRKVDISPEELVALANNSIGRSSEIFEKIIKHDVKMLKFLMAQLDEITEDFINKINQSKKEDMDIITSIKGINKTTAAHFLAEIKDIKRFDCKGKLSAFAGCDPSIKQSGTSINSRGKISKKGSKSLRRCLYLMASGVMKFNDYFKAYYLKKRSEGMPHRKAMIALVNKLLRTPFAMLTKKEVFQYHVSSQNL